MATCKYCGRSSWFLWVSTLGLCRQCDPVVKREILRRVQTISDSKKNLEANVGSDEKISECHIIINEAEALVKYEHKGIVTTNPSPRTLLQEYSDKKNEYEGQARKDSSVFNLLDSKVKEAQSKADLADNYKEKFTLFSAALDEVKNYKTQVSRAELLNELEKDVEALIRQLSTFSALLTYPGLKGVIQDLQRQIGEARERGDILPHLLLCGPFEPGKAALAHEIAREMGTNLKATDAAVIERPGDLAALLTNLEEGDILLVEQIEQLNNIALEALISAIADFHIDIIIGQGPAARSIKLDLKRFTLIGTTGKPSQLDKRLRRFLIVYNFADAKSALASLSEYVGQEAIKKDLRPRLDTAKRYSQQLPHLLLCGPREAGKAALASAVANEIKKRIDSGDSASLAGPDDLSDLLISLENGGLLLIERIELLKEPTVEFLVQAIENSSIAVTPGEEPNTQKVDRDVDLKKFTLIGTTSRPSQVDKRLRRWMITYDLAPYTAHEVGQIIQLIAHQEKLFFESGAADLLAECCEGSPGNARVLVKRLRDYVRAYRTNQVTVDLAREALVSFGYVGSLSTSTSLGSKLSTMDALEFEEFVASVFRDMGYAVEITQGSGDHGIDLFMRKAGQVTAVQCKRWNAPVGEPIVRDFYGSLMNAGAQSGYVITTSTFSSQAYSFAQGKPIQLLDLDALTNLLGRGGRNVKP